MKNREGLPWLAKVKPDTSYNSQFYRGLEIGRESSNGTMRPKAISRHSLALRLLFLRACRPSPSIANEMLPRTDFLFSSRRVRARWAAAGEAQAL
jgi:hypothetical protein